MSEKNLPIKAVGTLSFPMLLLPACWAEAHTFRVWIEGDEDAMHQRNLASKMHTTTYFIRSR